jgi:4-amino-4-deoxy-L-arabinose transferase-like glycosyltransferase
MKQIAGVLAAIVCVSAVIGLYTFRLGDTPPYIGLDEAHFGVHAQSLAASARDLNGSLLPLFISLADSAGDQPELPWGTTWYHPLGFYLIASVLTVLPLAEWAIRLPFALLGVLNLVLIYAVARRWYGDRRIAAAAAALLLLTPAHFILSRLALDYLLPLPFTLAWLLALTELMRAPSRGRAAVTGVILGAGCYAYVSAWLLMPIYLAISVTVAIRAMNRRDLLWPMIGGFALPILALAPWIAWHPQMPFNILAQYQAGETRRSVLTAIATGTGVLAALQEALATYWSYFNPSFLFVSGGSSRMVSTGSIGVWPVGMAVLMVAGVLRLMRTAPLTVNLIVVAGLLTAPIPAALKGEPFAIQRAVGLLPFGVLLATGGLLLLRDERRLLERLALTIAVISIPVQFSGFFGDYFGEYRVQSARALDVTAFKETAALLIERSDEAPAIAITAPLYDVSAKWRFYCLKAGRPELLSRTTYFGGAVGKLRGLNMPAGSLAVVETVTLDAEALPDGWVRVAAPRSVFDDTPLTILQRR